MLDILFQDGVVYHVTPPDRSFEYQDNGDRWGNTMIRFNHDVLTVHDVIAQIAPQLLDNAIAVLYNDKLVGLEKKVYENGSLSIITMAEPQGRILGHYAYAFLTAKYIYEISGQLAKILDYKYNAEYFLCRFETDMTITEHVLMAWIDTTVQNCAKILMLDQYQKTKALERYPSIAQTYISDKLNQMDEYDFLEISVLGDFALLAEFSTSIIVKHFSKNIFLSIRQDVHFVEISGSLL